MKTENRPEFPAERVKRIRKYFKENAETFARRFEVTGKTVESWEQGRRQVKGPAVVIFRQLTEVMKHYCPNCSRIMSLINRRYYCRVCEVGGGRVLAQDENHIPQVKKGKSK